MSPLRFFRAACRVALLLLTACSITAGAVQVREVDCTYTDTSPDRTQAVMRVDAQESPIPFTAIGFRLCTPSLNPGMAMLHVSFSNDGATWSSPLHTHIDDHTSDRASGIYYFDLVCLDRAVKYFKLQVSGIASQADSRQNTATAILIDAGATDGDPRANLERAKRNHKTVKRSGWGCPDGGQSPAWPPVYSPVTHLVVHHTADSSALTDWPAVVRAIWTYHTYTLGWGDIGYNYLCDPNGVVYQGRAGGNSAVGAHFSCQNSGTVGVALLGTFSDVVPGKPQLKALKRILTRKARLNNVDPLATAHHPGTDLTLPTLCGHRDANPSATVCSTTLCPGDALYERLPSIRGSVDARLNRKRGQDRQ